MKTRDIREVPGGDGFFIAMTVAAICIVCVVGAQWWQPYNGPGWFWKEPPKVVKADKFQDRFDAIKVKTITFRPPKRDPRCDGPARYEAMREAYERGRPQPC